MPRRRYAAATVQMKGQRIPRKNAVVEEKPSPGRMPVGTGTQPSLVDVMAEEFHEINHPGSVEVSQSQKNKWSVIAMISSAAARRTRWAVFIEPPSIRAA
jgi:hypothetical protein